MGNLQDYSFVGCSLCKVELFQAVCHDDSTFYHQRNYMGLGLAQQYEYMGIKLANYGDSPNQNGDSSGDVSVNSLAKPKPYTIPSK